MKLLSETTIELVKAILELIDNVTNSCEKFENEFDRLKHTLQDLLHWVENAKNLDDEMADRSKIDNLADRRQGEMAELVNTLENCEELVNKCVELPGWKFFRVKGYAEQLSGYNKILRNFLTMNMLSDIWESTIAIKPMKTNFGSALPEPIFTVGWEKPVAELKEKLSEEDAIGICGLGGSGKTTLVTKLCQQVRDKFRKIIFLPISKSPDWIEMVRRLWVDLVDASMMPKFVSVEDALQQLMYRLRERKPEEGSVLVVLDDVWSPQVLEKLVIRKHGFKTIITSRTEFKKLVSTYHIPELKMEDAKALFLYYALASKENPKSLDPQLVNVVEEIVKGCNYHPMSLKVIGASLEDKLKWKDTAKELVHGGEILGAYEQIRRCLETSLKPLSTKQMECFMDLGFFPDHKRIRASAVMDMWVEIRGLTENGVGSILQELSNRHLIELFERTGNDTLGQDESFNDLFIIQHDLLSELAVYVSRRNEDEKRLIINQEHDLPGVQTMQKLGSQSQIVSIVTGDTRESDWLDRTFPLAEVLILKFSSSCYHLPSFLQKMDNLKVLIITNTSMTAAEISGLPPSESLKNLKRVRLEKIWLPIRGSRLEPFQGLHKLSMVLCEVEDEKNFSTPDSRPIFPVLRELEIDYCNGLERLPPEVCEIEMLQKLIITNCHDLTELPEDIGRLSELQVLRLQACSSLEWLPESLCRLEKLRFLDLANRSCLSTLPQNVDKLCCLRKIDMRGCSATLPVSVRHMVELTDVICDSDSEILWEPFKTQLIKLKLHLCRDNVQLGFLR